MICFPNHAGFGTLIFHHERRVSCIEFAMPHSKDHDGEFDKLKYEFVYADIPNRSSSPTNVQLHDPDNRYKMDKRYFYSPQRKSDFDP